MALDGDLFHWIHVTCILFEKIVSFVLNEFWENFVLWIFLPSLEELLADGFTYWIPAVYLV